MSRVLRLSGVALVMAVLVLPVAAGAQTEVPVAVTGDSANRLDLVFLGDGYTLEEMPRFAADVNRVVDGMFAQEPFREYRGYFNVRRIDVASAESGASHPNRGITRNTAFGAYYNCGGTERLVCLDSGKVLSAAQAALPANARDMIVVLVNDGEYGGSGGSIIVASLHSDVVELMLHEAAHGFGQLADEYGGPPPPQCYDAVEPIAVNVTKETNPSSIKWAAWIDASTPIPTTSTKNGVPGLFAGAMYCDTTLYRPLYNSKMRSLGQAFRQVGTEQLIRRFYTFVDPIDNISPPATGTIEVAEGQPRTFTVSTPRPASHALRIGWWLDGQQKSSAAEYTLEPNQLPPGSHSLQVVVADPTDAVKADPRGLLTSEATWSISGGSAADFTLGAETTSLTLTRGQSRTISLTVTPVGGKLAADVSLSWAGVPANAQCSCTPVLVPSGSATTTVSLTISTTAPSAATPGSASTNGAGMQSIAVWCAAPLLLLASPRRRRRAMIALVVCGMAAASALLLVACGNGGSGTPTPPRIPNPGTPVGTYQVVVTAVSGAVSRAATIAVTVQ